MATSECQDESHSEVKWPIAPDGYIPNSVIRGWIRVLKRAKWGQDSEEDKEDDRFCVGPYAEDYKNLRAKRRPKKEQKMSYMKWDYRPDLDFPIMDGHSSVSKEEDFNWEKFSDQEKGNDENKDDLNLFGMRGRNDNREKVGFDLVLENKRPENSANRLNRSKLFNELVINPKVSYDQSRKETKTAEEKRKDTHHVSYQDMVVQNETHEVSTGEKVEEMPNRPMEDSEKIPSSELLAQKQEFSPERSTKSKKINSLKSKQVSILGKEPEVSLSELREVKLPTDDETKLPSKQKLFGGLPNEQVTTEKQDIAKMMDKQNKPPVKSLAPPSVQYSAASADTPTPKKTMADSVPLGEERKEFRNPLPSQPQPAVPDPRTHVSNSTRDSTQTDVDLKVLGLYKQLKNRKWVSSKPHGKWFSTNRQLSRSKWSFSGTELEDLGTAKSLYQKGYSEEVEREPMQPLDQSGLWQLIMKGVSESMDEDALCGLLQERLKDHTGSDMEGFSGVMDQRSVGRQGRAKPTIDESISAKFRAAQESMDNATSWELIRDIPSDFQARTEDLSGFSKSKDDGIQRRNSRSSMSMDQNRFSTLRVEGLAYFTDGPDRQKDLALETLNQAAPRWSTADKSTESMLGSGRLEGLNGEVCKFAGGLKGLGKRESSLQSTIQTGLAEKDYSAESHESVSKRLGQGQSNLERFSNFSHGETRPDSTETAGSTAEKTGQNHESLPKQVGQSSVEGTQGFDEFMFDNDDRRRQSIGGTIQSRSQTEALENLEPKLERSGMRFSESQTSLGGTGVRRPEDRSIVYSRQNEFQEPRTHGSYGRTRSTVNRLNHSMGYDDAGWELSNSSAKNGAGMGTLTSRSNEALAQAGSEGQVKHSQSSSNAEGLSKDKSGNSNQSVPGYAQSTAGTKAGDRSQDLSGLQMMKSMVHTPGLLTSSEPEQFLKIMYQKSFGGKTKTKPMPKWRQELYQHIFQYGFCSPQTAKLLATEKCKQVQPLSIKQQRDNFELYEFLDAISPSELHERVVRKIQFHDILDQATSDFHCMIPLPSINNFITLEKYGETEYGKLLFEWERGNDGEEQMKVVNAYVCEVVDNKM